MFWDGVRGWAGTREWGLGSVGGRLKLVFDNGLCGGGGGGGIVGVGGEAGGEGEGDEDDDGKAELGEFHGGTWVFFFFAGHGGYPQIRAVRRLTRCGREPVGRIARTPERYATSEIPVRKGAVGRGMGTFRQGRRG